MGRLGGIIPTADGQQVKRPEEACGNLASPETALRKVETAISEWRRTVISSFGPIGSNYSQPQWSSHADLDPRMTPSAANPRVTRKSIQHDSHNPRWRT
jgi:hypothetical protein